MATKRTLLDFFAPSTKKAQEDPVLLCGAIVHDIIRNVVDKVEQQKKKHTGENVKDSTFAEWQVRYPWLETKMDEQGNRRLLCKVCVKANVRNVWGQEGAINVQLSTISRHKDSKDHQTAERKIAYLVMSNIDSECLGSSDSEEDVSIVVEENDKRLFSTVFYAAKEELPSEKVNSLLELQAKNGVTTVHSKDYKNVSWDSVKDVQSSIASVMEKQLFKQLKQSPVFGIMIDESQDLSVQKKLAICVRYLDSTGAPITKFLCNLRIDDGKASTIVARVTEKMKSIGLDMGKLVSLGTDGAAVMLGSKTGVGVQLRAKYSPFLTQTHCLAHRLSLACTDSMKKMPVLDKFTSRFNSLYALFHTSAIRTTKLEKVQEVMDDPVLKMKETHSVRWLSMRKAVEAVHRSYPSVVVSLSELAADGNATASSLHKYFSSYKSAVITAFMLDVHNVVGILCRELQKQTLLFNEIQPLVDATFISLESLLKEDGDNLGNLRLSLGSPDTEGKCISLKGVILSYSSLSDAEFNLLREQYVKNLKENIGKRFQNEDNAIFTHLGNLLEPATVLENSESEIGEALNGICTFYGQAKKVRIQYDSEGLHVEENEIAALLDGQTLQKKEWRLLHGMIKGSYKGCSMTKICRRVASLHGDLMPNIAKVCKIALCLCATSVECERAFSTQNRIKTKFRCSLKSETIDTLMKIVMLGPSFRDYDPTTAIKLWHARKKRRPARLSQPYTPSQKKTKIN